MEKVKVNLIVKGNIIATGNIYGARKIVNVNTVMDTVISLVNTERLELDFSEAIIIDGDMKCGPLTALNGVVAATGYIVAVQQAETPQSCDPHFLKQP